MLSMSRIFVFELLFAIIIGACSKSSQMGRNQTLIVSINQEPQNLDPLSAETGASLFVVKQLTSTLLSTNSDGEVSVQDAESYAWSRSGHELEIRVKPFLKYSNGEPLKACDFREAIVRALAPNTRGVFSDLLFDLEGYKAEWSQAEFEKSKSFLGVECQNETHSLKLKVKTKFSRKMLYAFTFPITSPLHVEYPSVVTGAYRLNNRESGVSLTLERNRFHESFYRSKNILFAKILFIKDAFTARALFQKGEVDVLDEIPVQAIEAHSQNGTLKTFPFVATYMLGFGFQKNPVDLETRRKFSQILRHLEIEKMLTTGESRAKGWVPPSLAVGPVQEKAINLWNISTQTTTSVANSKNSKKKYSVYFNPSDRNTLVMERVSRIMFEQAQVSIQLEPTEWKVLLAKLKTQAPSIYRFAWTAVYPDPLFFLEIFLSDNPNNYGKWKNLEYDKIVRQLLSWPSYERSDKFWELFEKAHRILVVEDPALVPLYSYVKNFIVSARVKNWNSDFRGIADLSAVDL
jgi:oligopeptide transport system substrate-binding protein